MKVLFGQSYYQHFDPKLAEARRPYPPLGTMIAAAAVRDLGHDVALFDAMLATSEQEWVRSLDRERPDVAVLFEDNFNYLSKMCLLRMRQAALTMIGAAREHDIPVLVCGSDATDNAALFLDAGAEVVMTGEGDATLVELMGRLDRGLEAASPDVAGIFHRSASGDVVRTPDRPNIKDLDALPPPAWDLVDVGAYRRIWLDAHGHYSVNMVTTRGCPYHCNWCAKPIWGQRYNARSPESVVAEMELLVESVGPDHIWFADDIFGLKPGWIGRFADLLEERNLRIPFKCLSRPDLLLKGSTIRDLARAGCETVWIGAESGSQKVLDAMEKGTTVEQIVEAADRVHAAGFKIAFFLQFGYPGEDLDDIEATFAMVRRSGPDDIGMSVSYPLPGTKFHERVSAQLGEVRNWVDSDDMAMLFEGPYPTAFYRRLHEVLHMDYRSHRTWQALKRALAERNPTAVEPRSVAVMIRDRLRLPLARRALMSETEGGSPTVTRLRTELDPAAAAAPSRQPDHDPTPGSGGRGPDVEA